jgi:hypothetical protein
MLIPSISRVDSRTHYARRSPTDARAGRPPASVPAQAAAEPAETDARDDGDPDDASAPATQQGMTLADAQAAYASN